MTCNLTAARTTVARIALGLTVGTLAPLLALAQGAAAPIAAQPVAPTPPADQAQATPASQPPPAEPEPPRRDEVGDLNAGLIQAGGFPGSFLIPGPRGVSLAIGGFMKNLVLHDTAAEGRRAIFLPALLGGIGRDDEDGTTALTAELSRVSFDARARTGDGHVRGYIEFDFLGGAFNWRHGFLVWGGPWGEVLGGTTWSTFMDLRTMPDGLGEPTISGAIFMRQAQFRYSRRVTPLVRWAVSVEDASSNDVVAGEPVLTRMPLPDLISTISIAKPIGHIQAGALMRTIAFDPNGREGGAATGWGLQLSGHMNLSARDKVYGAFVFGDGLGRYLLGITPSAGAFIDVDTGDVSTRENSGGFVGVRHVWNGRCRSSLVWSRAQAETDPRQPSTAFTSSSFTLANVLCSANQFLTMGFEYNYGTRTNRDASRLDSHRLMFGMQLF